MVRIVAMRPVVEDGKGVYAITGTGLFSGAGEMRTANLPRDRRLEKVPHGTIRTSPGGGARNPGPGSLVVVQPDLKVRRIVHGMAAPAQSLPGTTFRVHSMGSISEKPSPTSFLLT